MSGDNVFLTEEEKEYLQLNLQKRVLVDATNCFLDWLKASREKDEFITLTKADNISETQRIRFVGPLFDPDTYERTYGLCMVSKRK